MIERFAALLRRGDRDLQLLAHAVLPDVFVERARPQSRFVLDVVVDRRGVDEAIVRRSTDRRLHRVRSHVIIPRSTSRSACSNEASGAFFSAASTAFSAAARW